MLNRWLDLETLRLSLANIQDLLEVLQTRVDQLREKIDFRLDPLTHEVEELRQRYDVNRDS